MEMFIISSFNYKYKVTHSDSLRNPMLKYYTVIRIIFNLFIS
jgi:hypothetical protein